MSRSTIADLSKQLNALSTQDGPDEQATNAHHRVQPNATSLARAQPPPTEPELGPIEHIAYYSCTGSGDISFDLSCLRPFREPRLPVDLRKGRELFYERNKHNRSLGHPVPLDNLVRACIAHGQESQLRSADVVTWRGLLTKWGPCIFFCSMSKT
jgi:hypothetical protein